MFVEIVIGVNIIILSTNINEELVIICNNNNQTNVCVNNAENRTIYISVSLLFLNKLEF